jgi:hypothetical protein
MLYINKLKENQTQKQSNNYKFQPCPHPCVWAGKETCKECLIKIEGRK